MTSDWSILLAPWPLYSQNNSPTADGQPDENASQDCGPTVVSAIIDYLTGVRIYPDTIKDLILGQDVTGPTSGAQLRNFLRQFASTDATSLTPTGARDSSAGGLPNLIWQYTHVGKPLIELRQYSPTANFLHWVAVIGIDPTTIAYHDPFTGSIKYEAYAQHAALYRGTLLGIERARDSGL